MASTGETMDQKAKRAAEDAKSGAAEFAETARERAREMADEAKTRAYEYGRDYKDDAANETSKIANALRKAADDLHDGSPQERVFAKLADTVADTADGMRDMELDEMAYAVNDFARRNSAAFLGGAALLGFVAARFMKASARHDDKRTSGYGQGTYGQSAYGQSGRTSPDMTPNDYDEEDRMPRPVPTSSPTSSAAPRPAPTTTTQPTSRPATTGATTGTSTAAGSTCSMGSTGTAGSTSSMGSTGSSSSVGGIDKPDEKPEIPGAPQPGTTGAVKK